MDDGAIMEGGPVRLSVAGGSVRTRRMGGAASATKFASAKDGQRGDLRRAWQALRLVCRRWSGPCNGFSAFCES